MSLTDKVLRFDPSVTPRGVTLGTGASLDARGDFTFECWAKPSSLEGSGMVLWSLGASDLLKLGEQHIWLTLQHTLRKEFRIAPELWHHFALRFNATKKIIDLCLNGTWLFGNINQSSPIDEATSIFLGSAAEAERPFAGDISEVRVWNRTRSVTQIRADMYRRLSGEEDGLAAYFPLDGREGDSESAARDAKLARETGAPEQPPASVQGASFVPGDLPLARERDAVVVADFDGRHGRITVPDSPSLSFGEQFTVEAWVRPTGTGKPTYMFPVVSKHGAGEGWELRAGAGMLGFLVTLDSTYHEVQAPLPAGVWSHVAGVYSSGRLSIRINAREVSAHALSSPSFTQSLEPLVIGGSSYWPTHKFQGEIAEVRIWKVARSYVQMRETLLLTTRLGEDGAPADLVAAYRMQCEAKDAVGGLDGVAEFVRWSRSAPPLPRSSPAAIESASSDDPDALLVQNSALVQENAALQASVEAAQGQVVSARTQELELRDQISEDIEAITALRSREIELLPKRVSHDERVQIAAALEQELQELQAPSSSVEISSFAQKLGSELASAQQAMRAQAQDPGAGAEQVELTEVKLALRMFTTTKQDQRGVAVRFPTLGELAQMDDSSLSTFNLDIDAQAPPQAPKPPPLVPSVTGYTESAARRKLARAGFGVEVALQAADPASAHRVVTQLPTGGAAAPLGSEVTIFIGRPVTT